MTSRISKPNTDTDLDLAERLARPGNRHFVMVAGAGSGKTTSLIKALDHLAKTQGEDFRRQGKQIACITYTDIAVEEIEGDVGHDPLFHVSTIHSFLWTVIKPFQKDLRTWIKGKLVQKIEEAEAKLANPRTRQATKDRETINIEKYKDQKGKIDRVSNFRYGTGSDYLNGVLGHSDILAIGPDFIDTQQLMRRVIAQRFPITFVDESQDTDPKFVSAMMKIARELPNEFCLGFFGDPVQKIYMQGAGPIPIEEGWETLRKPENFRCPQKVLQVINRIRAEDDKLVQTGGRMEDNNGELVPVQGTARIMILPADERRQERLEETRSWLSELDDDPSWADQEEGDLRLLVLLHRMAANRLGFPNIYSALNDKAPENLKTGLTDGTAWVFKPFIPYILPLMLAYRQGMDFEVMRLLRKYCPGLQPENLAGKETAASLATLKQDLQSLNELLSEGASHSVGDVIAFIKEKRLAILDERFDELLEVYKEATPLEVESPENSGYRFMLCNANELWGHRRYIEELSPFATQQGVKGAEFEKVLVIIDDEEGKTNTFSYGKYFGSRELSDTDERNIAEGRDSVVDRTRRLFYVCCSRALCDLAVVVFAEDQEEMRKAILSKGFFDREDVHMLS